MKEQSQSTQVKTIGGLVKIIKGNPLAYLVALLSIALVWSEWKGYKKDEKYENLVNSVHLLVFPIVDRVQQNGREIEVIKVKEAVEDSLQKK